MLKTIPSLVNNLKQPKGGMLPPRLFTKTPMFTTDGDYYEIIEEDSPKNINIITLTVNYLTRYIYDEVDEVEVFQAALTGARTYGLITGNDNELDGALELLPLNKILDYEMVNDVLKLMNYQAVYKNNYILENSPLGYTDYPKQTVTAIIEMIERTLLFIRGLDEVVVKFGYNFEIKENILKVSSDNFLTNSKIINIKCIRGAIDNKNTAQLMLNFIVGLCDGIEEFSNIEELGFWNPRFSEYSSISLEDIEWSVFENFTKAIPNFRVEQLELLHKHIENIS